MNENQNVTKFDPEAGALVVQDLVITDDQVAREARHWTGGRRGPSCENPEELGRADMTAFATEAIVIGARVLAATSQTTEARAVEQMLRDVGDKTADATTKAAAVTKQVVLDATTAVGKAAADAKKTITEAEAQNRKELTAAVDGAKRDLTAEIRRLFGGDSPELLERLRPVLDKFGVSLETQVRTSTVDLLEKVAKQFDPTDPSSPMAKHAATLSNQQERFAQQISENHRDLTAKVEELTTTLRVNEARTTLAKVTPIKGGSFENTIHELMAGVAAGLGDEYVDTTTTVGLVPRSKKGDGVLSVEGGSTRVVIEATDSARTGWGAYFDEAERNRGAVAALGLVRSQAQNGNQAVRVLGSRRVVMAYNPDSDDPEMLRTVLMLLRTVAIAATARTGASEIATAEEKIAHALVQLERIDSIKKLANGIQKNATKIEGECTGIATTIHRLLDRALVALGGTMTDDEVQRDGGIAAA